MYTDKQDYFLEGHFIARHKKAIDGCVLVIIKTQNDVITHQTEDIQLRDTVSVYGTSAQ